MFRRVFKATVSFTILNFTPYLPFTMFRACGVNVAKMEEFFGKKYELVNSENFDDLLVYIDTGFLQRKIAMTLRPVQYITREDDGTYTLHFKCTLVSFKLVFTPGVEFDETKPDGVIVRALVTIEGNKVYHRQVEKSGRTLNHMYEFFPDKMIITSTGPGMKSIVKRNYVAVK